MVAHTIQLKSRLMNPTNEESSILKSIEGLEVGSVIFVRDYCQICFDGAILSLITWPSVITNQETFDHKMFGYRDMLCRLIGNAVCKVVETTDAVTLLFSNNLALEISLRDEDREAAEAIIFTDVAGKRWAVR